jgi:hypothetical protein
VGQGILATGRIDLAAAIQAHGAQLGVYSQALGTITGAPVRAALCLLRSGQLLDLGEGARP